MHNGDQYHDVVIFAQQNKAHFSANSTHDELWISTFITYFILLT